MNAADQASAAWQKLKAYYQEKLISYHSQLEGDLTELQTAKLRGRIAEINGFLALENPPPIVTLGDEQSPLSEY
ncbi:MAG: hypothetical protein CTY37_06190 [Methylotenera sp.]|nr:MAG: hypothetical protein CTY37_06190 [Methylotenera sp.]